MSETNELTQKILNFLLKEKAYAWRASSTGIFDRKLGIYRPAAKKGVSDIVGCHRGRFIGIEIKTGKDRLSPEQEGFQRSIQQAGGIALVVRNFDDFFDQFLAATQEK